MKPGKKFQLRVHLNSTLNPNSKAEAIVARKAIETKNEQLARAMKWCIENDKRGHSAIKSGLFPLIKDRQTINRRLDGKVKNGSEREYCTILTQEEEESIIAYIKNKNRAMQGIGRPEVKKLVMDVLRVRDYANKKMKGGRKFKALSKNAKTALKTNK